MKKKAYFCILISTSKINIKKDTMEDVTIYANSAYNNISTGEKIFRDAGHIVNNDGRKIDRTSLMNMLGDDAYHSLQSAQRAYRVGRNLIV